MLRQAEKDYYSSKLESLNTDIKGTWEVLRKVLNGGCETQFYPKEFKSEGRVVTNKTDIVNGYDTFLLVSAPSWLGRLDEETMIVTKKYLSIFIPFKPCCS